MDFGLTDEMTREFTEAFNDLDKNRTGFLAVFELGVLMRSLGHTLQDEDMWTAAKHQTRKLTARLTE